MPKLREIERLKACAVLMVIAVHWDVARAFLPEVARSSWSGVDLFFVISGYLAALSLLRLLPPRDEGKGFIDAYAATKQSLKSYYLRRFFRVAPMIVGVLLLDRFLMTAFPQDFGWPHQWWEEVVTFFGGLYNYVLAYHTDYRMGVLWSLEVGAHFFVLLTLVFLALRTTAHRLAACAVIAALSIALRALPHPDGVDVVSYEMYASHLRLDTPMAGAILALVASRTSTTTPTMGAIMPRWLLRFAIVPAVLVLVVCLPGAAGDNVMLHEGVIALWFLSALLVGLASLDRGYVLAIPVLSRALEYVGSRSYALYLTHTLVARLEDSVGQQAPEYRALVPEDVSHPWRKLVVMSAATLILSEVLYRVLEKPCTRIGVVLADGALTLSRRSRRLLVAGAVLLALFFFRHTLLKTFGRTDLALHKPVTQSSHADGKPESEALVNGELESEYGLHTKKEDLPWAVIDLGQPTDIGSVRIYNRADGYQGEALPLELSVSDDGKDFRTIARRDTMFTQFFPWRIRIYDEKPRYVRVQVAATNATLCLSEVEIYEGDWSARLP